jgi:two-component system KDP operon response regulator KdpE
LSQRILIVDDEQQILRFLAPTLQAAGYEVVTADRAGVAISRLSEGPVSAVVLDLGLPDMDGKDAIVAMRALTKAPILVLSARDQDSEKIQALDRGANDYVVKPFSVGELLARLRVLMRAAAIDEPPRPDVITVGEVELDLARRRASGDGVIINLTRREAEFLRVVADGDGEPVPTRVILQRIWGERDLDVQLVRVLASQVRQKLETVSEQTVVQTVPGLGYRLGL